MHSIFYHRIYSKTISSIQVMKQYYLTFDIGTENLAYCLASFSPNGTNIETKYEIITCGVTCIDGVKLKCIHQTITLNGKKQKTKTCGKKALHYDMCNNKYVGYCQAHKTNNSLRMSSNVTFSTSFMDKIDRLMLFLEGLMKIINMHTTIGNLNIHIENQPALLTPIMKTISVAVFSYFRAKQTTFPKLIKTVRFVSPSIKTSSVFIENLQKVLGLASKIKNFKVYENRKLFAEDIVGQFFDKIDGKSALNCANYAKFHLLKKKDDVCDTILYVLHATIC